MTAIDRTYLHEPEVRVTNAETGGQKGAKLTQVGALDPVSLIEVGRIAGMGAAKYSAYNFMQGTDWSLMWNAAQRHLLRMWAGEDRDICTTEGHSPAPHEYDPASCNGSGLLHAAHAAWMCLALVGFQLRATGNDDRPPAVGAPALTPESVRAIVLEGQMRAMLDQLEARVTADHHGENRATFVTALADARGCESCGFPHGHSVSCPDYGPA